MRSLSARIGRLEQSIQIGHDSPIVVAAVLRFIETGKLAVNDHRVLDIVLDQAELALLGFDELGDPPDPDSVARACERDAARYFMCESVDLPTDVAERLAKVDQLKAERLGHRNRSLRDL